MTDIIRLQLGRIASRIAAHHKVPFTWDDSVVQLIASRCTEPESGGRMIDAILTNTMLPSISGAFLERVLEGETVAGVRVGVEGSEFSYAFD
jgi:type VI secretion system protein VasG